MNLQEKLIHYVSEELLNGQYTVQPDDDLLGDAIVDSMGMMWLIGYIEDELAYQIPPEDLVIENFRTIGTIEAYLTRRAA